MAQSSPGVYLGRYGDDGRGVVIGGEDVVVMVVSSEVAEIVMIMDDDYLDVVIHDIHDDLFAVLLPSNL